MICLNDWNTKVFMLHCRKKCVNKLCAGCFTEYYYEQKIKDCLLNCGSKIL